MTDQTATFMPRAELDSRFNALGDRIGELSERVNRNDGRVAGGSRGADMAFLALPIAISVLSLGVALWKGLH